MPLLSNYRRSFRLWTRRVALDARGNLKYARPRPLDEGLAIATLRFFWLPFVAYHFLVFNAIMLMAGFTVLLFTGGGKWEERSIRGLFYLLVDLYVAAWTLILIICYSICYESSVASIRSLPGRGPAGLLVPGGVALFRLYEIWAFIGGLHCQERYATHNVVRAIINTFWHYAETILCFAILYLCASCLTQDSFSSATALATDRGGIAEDFVTPLYFSTITVATVGFGDLAPRKPAGRLVVMAQVFFGIFLFVVILQRAMSSQEFGRSRQRPDSDDVIY